MARQRVCGWALGGVLLMTAGGVGAQTEPAPAPAGTTPAPAGGTANSASVTLGGETILTLRATAGGMTPQQRVDTIDGRLSDLLGIPNIKPANVAVYTPAGKAPVIYALGRRLITVDAATAKAEGSGKKPLELAETWAKTLQQVLPRVNYRPSNEKEPVIPAHPPLTVTDDLSKVGGNVGYVSLRNKVVFKITGPQSGGLTAQERAVILTKRIQVAANRLPSASASDISVAPVAAAKGSAQEQILVGSTPIIAVDQAQAKASGFQSSEQLANAWAKNVRTALGLTNTTAPATATAATGSPTVNAPAPAAAAPPPAAANVPTPAPPASPQAPAGGETAPAPATPAQPSAAGG